MAALVVFRLILLVAVFVSGLAQRSSIVSTAGVFLLGGAVGHVSGVLVYTASSGLSMVVRPPCRAFWLAAMRVGPTPHPGVPRRWIRVTCRLVAEREVCAATS